MPDDTQRIAAALAVAMTYGATDGAHHKQWVIDLMVRALTGCPAGGLDESEEYKQWVEQFEDGEDGPLTYEWDTGIAP